jgi:hypothetical protein
MAWLLYQTADRKKLKNQKIVLRYKWKEAIDLMRKISGIKYRIPIYKHKMDFGRWYNVEHITSRYTSLVMNRMRDKFKDDLWIYSPGVKFVQKTIDSLRVINKQRIKEGKLYDSFEKRLFEFIMESRAITFRDLCLHFSGKRIRQILLEIGLPVPYGNGIIIGILKKRIAFYVGEDIPITETIEKLQSISKKRGYGSLKLIAQVLEMFSRRIKIPSQLHMQSGLNLEENKKPLFLEEKGKSWVVTAEGLKSIIEWPDRRQIKYKRAFLEGKKTAEKELDIEFEKAKKELEKYLGRKNFRTNQEKGKESPYCKYFKKRRQKEKFSGENK